MLIGEDDISNEVTWYLTLQTSQGLASCKKFLVLCMELGLNSEFQSSGFRFPQAITSRISP